ncbi:hypothetical protein GCM10010123_37220 [Pilimelia anulata]|uniref:Ricin B lectin domain-containing protein n=1 Tax=Pilimelia anulata TaxID=53371 RepID=A0A8J3BE50_9ACTN|nr:ricin-type beta-trefoil lectin domain protein [Pilimelia anulata]GGK03826.1 hypothetical protein GCM10010123_37220 [Pilimelia anulata]
MSPAARLRRLRGAERGSLPLALVLVGTAVSVSTVALSTSVVEIVASRQDAQREGSLAAARTALDLAIGGIRAAHTPADATAGDRAKLPCGPLSGTDAVAGRYRVDIRYLRADPHGRADGDTAWWAANTVACTATDGPAQTPAFALLRARGSTSGSGALDAAPGRSVWATYVFRTIDDIIPGGLIRGFGVNLCLAAGGTPAAGVPVVVATCADGDAGQTFAYRPDLSLALTATRGADALCIDGGAPHAAGAAVFLRRCLSPMAPRQQWIYEDWGNFRGTNAAGTDIDEYCLNATQANVVNSPVRLGVTNRDDANGLAQCGPSDPLYTATKTFVPAPTAGAGRSGPAMGQVVNRHQFGRCIDVTAEEVEQPYLILWPCKQKAVGQAHWNQRFTLPAPSATAPTATGPVVVAEYNFTDTQYLATHCLLSPGSTARGRYVRLVTCDPAGRTPAGTRWTVTRATDDPATSYRIREADEDGDGVEEGYCLSATDSSTYPDFHELQDNPQFEIGKLIVAGCDDSNLQKWNAPPQLVSADPLKDFGEGPR